MRVRVKERVSKKERKILGFRMLLRVNMEVKKRMGERKKRTKAKISSHPESETESDNNTRKMKRKRRNRIPFVQ